MFTLIFPIHILISEICSDFFILHRSFTFLFLLNIILPYDDIKVIVLCFISE